MGRVSKRILNKDLEGKLFQLFIDTILNLKNKTDVSNFMEDLLSPVEKLMLVKRLAIAILLTKKYTYQEIDEKLKVSRPTIMTVSNALKIRGDGYRKAIERVIKKQNKENVFLNIEELLLKLSGPKMKSTIGFEKKKEQGKKIFTKRKKLNQL
jgi:TrpR-related protein YerC/YecD